MSLLRHLRPGDVHPPHLSQHPHEGLRTPSQQTALPKEQPQTPPCQEQHPAPASRSSVAVISSHSCEEDVSLCITEFSMDGCSAGVGFAVTSPEETNIIPNVKATSTISFFIVYLLVKVTG